MRGLVFSLLFLVTISGCAKPSPAIRTQIVEKPVIQVQKCIAEEDTPVRPEPLAETPVPFDLETALSLALAKIADWTRYGNKTETAIKNCQAP
jgi:hypothetical protein